MLDRLLETLSMSGYAAYVWTTFGVSILALVMLYVILKKRLQKALIQQKHLDKS